MIKQRIRACICMLATVIFSFSAVSCGDSAQTKKTTYEIWGAYATAKVGQDAAKNGNFEKLPGSLNVSMMKNETEGGQIIVTAEKDVESFTLNKGELKTSDGKIFPEDKITVYQQKYIKINQKSDFNGVYSIGEFVPDMLLKADIAEKYKENHFKAGENQGIYVEFDSEGVEAGVYNGTFVMDCDGVKTDVPVSVEVWNIEYTGRRTFQSCFVLYQSSLLRSEYDNSDETVNNYIDFFLDYKIDICLHNKRRNDFDSYGEAWLDSVKRTKDNPNYNSVYIPYQFPPYYVAYSGSVPTTETEECLKYVLALAEICTPDDFYLDYAYFYPFELDEADIDTGNRAENAARMLSEGGDVDQMLALAVERVKSDKDGKFAALKQLYGEDFIARIEQAILKIPTLFTNVGFIEEWVDDYSASFCPYLSVFSDGRVADHYNAATDEKGSQLWTYTCVGPTYPYPTFHIDDYNLGTRISGWMEKYYGIDGYLYWAVTNDFYVEECYKYLDPYTDPTRYKGADGDGYLVYPGNYYGSSTPLPSLRLVAYCDSMDDYDMLCVYENLLKDYYEKYNLGELDFNEYVEDLYFGLFKGAIYYTDDSLVFAARKELAKRILALQKEDGVILIQSHSDNQTAAIYAGVEKLSVNGKSVTGQKTGENAYRFDLNVSEIGDELTVISDNCTVTFDVKKTKGILLLSEKISTSEDGSFVVGENSVAATLKAKSFGSGFDDTRTMSFTPYVSITADNFPVAQKLCMAVTNNSGEATDIYVRIIVNGMVYELGSAYVKNGATKNVRLGLSDLANISGEVQIQVYVQNVLADENGDYALQNDKTLTVSNIYLEL